MERRFSSHQPIQIEEREGKNPAIAGYGSVFYDGTEGTEYKLYTDFIERIAPGAFTRALQEQQDVRGLFNHDSDHILGRTAAGTMVLSVDTKGLRYEIDPPDTNLGRDLQQSIKRGDISGSSFGFRVMKQSWAEVGDVVYRVIEDVDLYDVGPVTFPAYKGASTAVRAEGDVAEARVALEAWRAEQRPKVVRVRMDVAARARVLDLEVHRMSSIERLAVDLAKRTEIFAQHGQRCSVEDVRAAMSEAVKRTLAV